jgi:hypothetical protein
LAAVKITVGQGGRFEASFDVGTAGGNLFWYFPGPDARYNGSGTFLHTTEMQAFVNSVREAWSRYEQLLEAAEGLELSQTRKIDRWSFGLATGGYRGGVVPFSNVEFASRICLRTEEDLDALITVVEEAQALFPRLAALAATTD